ncbi:hypothetical protein GT034_13000 [Streptomyces sp. SID2563]|uniref:hypothetical protein n=1 Tax=Streptomyces sp. SID2563 TaxID=2690255 RepID=UPI00136E97BE|nr:hypothetical protein [Streptomyces sp. SID2563]MYW09263.1 hypothetical protein [Streptomyces sp. SID2563]
MAAAAVGLLGVGLTACSGSDGSTEAGPVTKSPVPTSASPSASAEDEAKKQVAEVVRRMREEETKAHVDPGKVTDTKLTDYATDKALADINNQLFQADERGEPGDVLVAGVKADGRTWLSRTTKPSAAASSNGCPTIASADPRVGGVSRGCSSGGGRLRMTKRGTPGPW